MHTLWDSTVALCFQSCKATGNGLMVDKKCYNKNTPPPILSELLLMITTHAVSLSRFLAVRMLNFVATPSPIRPRAKSTSAFRQEVRHGS